MKKIIRAFQRTSFARHAIERVWRPVYDIFFTYILNFRGRKALKSFELGHRTTNPLNHGAGRPVSPFFLWRDEEVVAKIARLVSRDIPAERLISIKENALRRRSNVGFTTDISGILTAETRETMLLSLVTPAMMDYMCSYFKFVPRFESLMLLYNYPIPGLAEEGSKAWHRDEGDADYKQIKVFVPLTTGDEESGPFHYLDAPDISFNSMLPPNSVRESWLGGRVENSTVEALGSRAKINKVVGPPGTILAIDTVTVYHKGGFCRSRDRLMLQMCFQGEGYSANEFQKAELLSGRSAKEFASKIGDSRIAFSFAIPPFRPVERTTLKRIVGPVKKFLYLLNRRVFSYYISVR